MKAAHMLKSRDIRFSQNDSTYRTGKIFNFVEIQSRAVSVTQVLTRRYCDGLMQFILTEQTGIVMCGPHSPRVEYVTLEILQTMTMLVLFGGIKTRLAEKKKMYVFTTTKAITTPPKERPHDEKKSVRKIVTMDVKNISSMGSMNLTSNNQHRLTFKSK